MSTSQNGTYGRQGLSILLAAILLSGGTGAVDVAQAAGLQTPPRPLPVENSIETISYTDAPVPGVKPGAVDALDLLRFGPQEPKEDKSRKVPKPAQKPLAVTPAQEAAVTPAAMPAPPAAKPPVKAETPRPVAEAVAVTLPKAPLSGREAALYKEIFSFQQAGDWTAADAAMARLNDRRLLGHVLYQRYMHPSWKASFNDLAYWLTLYADQPGASRIYRLATARRPSGSTVNLREPIGNTQAAGYLDVLFEKEKTYVSPQKRGPGQKKDIERLNRAIKTAVSKGRADAALKLLSRDAAAKLMDHAEYDRARAEIAAAYMYAGSLSTALDLAAASARRSGDEAPLAGWVGGLSAWRLGQFNKAADLFEQTATSSYASGWTRSAGAYWASRAHLRAGHPRKVSRWLETAAEYPRTFYGLIAMRALGRDFDFNWKMPEFTPAHKARLEKYPAGLRAMALVAAGQYDLAENELRQIDARDDEKLAQALLAYANAAALPSFALRLAESTQGPKGRLYDAALYPVSPWKPEGGYKIDRALINALIRQESRFDPHAESHSGAQGLMQLMPATASFVSGEQDFQSRAGKHFLRDPQTNIGLGQRYVEDLLKLSHVNEELLSMVIAYNAGPGNLRKWKTRLSGMADDPLLFVESIPAAETRTFVERVMANYWIYGLRLHSEAPSLGAVAEGKWAQYVSIDKEVPFQIADNRGQIR